MSANDDELGDDTLEATPDRETDPDTSSRFDDLSLIPRRDPQTISPGYRNDPDPDTLSLGERTQIRLFGFERRALGEKVTVNGEEVGAVNVRPEEGEKSDVVAFDPDTAGEKTVRVGGERVGSFTIAEGEGAGDRVIRPDMPTSDEVQMQKAEETGADPRAEDSELGSAVTGAEAERLIEESRETGEPVENLEDRPALSSQLERQIGVDPRELGDRGGVDRTVSFDPDSDEFTAERETETSTARTTSNLITDPARRGRPRAPTIDEPVTRTGDAIGSGGELDFGSQPTPDGPSTRTPLGTAFRSRPVQGGITDVRPPDERDTGTPQVKRSTFGAVTAPGVGVSSPAPQEAADEFDAGDAAAAPLTVPVTVGRALAKADVVGTIRDVRGGRERREDLADRTPLGRPENEDEIVEGLREETGAPTIEGLNEQIGEITGTNPRTTVEGGQAEARKTTLTTLAEGARFAQENPAKAAAVGVPAALAEPTPLGEAGLLAGFVAGAVGVDVASRIEPDDADDPSAFGPEIPTPTGRPEDSGEITVPDRRPDTTGELGFPEERPTETPELPAPERAPGTTGGELPTPEPTEDPPALIRTQELIGRQRARQEQREEERDRTLPSSFIPDEDVVIGDETPTITDEPTTRDPFEPGAFDRPEGGVRTFPPETTEPEMLVDEPPELGESELFEVVDGSAGQPTFTMLGAEQEGRLDELTRTQADVGQGSDLDVEPLSRSAVDARLRSRVGVDVGARLDTRQDQLLGQQLAQQQRLRNPTEQRTQNRTVNEQQFERLAERYGYEMVTENVPTERLKLPFEFDDDRDDDGDPFGFGEKQTEAELGTVAFAQENIIEPNGGRHGLDLAFGSDGDDGSLFL